MLEERRLRTDDNPEDALDEMVRAQAYVAHPYHWPVIGWFHDVDGLTLADAMAYHKIYYSPQNALIVAVGDFDGDQVMKQISEAFGGNQERSQGAARRRRSSRRKRGRGGSNCSMRRICRRSKRLITCRI